MTTTRSRARRSFRDRQVGHAAALGSLGGWAAATAVVAAGPLPRLPTRLLPVPVAAGLGGLMAGYTRVDPIRSYVDGLSLRALTAFNVWRVPAALGFFRHGSDGRLPARFAANAGWGDLVAGLAALPVLAAGRLPPGPRRGAYLAFHLFSLADFVVAVGTGFAFALRQDPRMDTLKTNPMALVPLFGVPLTGAVSLVALRRLLAERDDGQPAAVRREPLAA